MFVIQLSQTLKPYLGVHETPSKDLIDKFEKAVFCVATNFTLQIKPEDQSFLYLRYKKIRRPLSPAEYILHPRVSLGLASLYGYSDSDLMQQYVDKVVELNIGFDPEAAPSKARSGFSKGVSSRLKEIEDDPEFVDGDLVQLVDYIREGNLEEVKNLILARPELLETHMEGIYPIHHAADFGQLDILNSLIDLGASLKQQDTAGQTVLHYAASNGHFEVVQYLLAKGLDPEHKCNDGLTPKDIADVEIIELFEVSEA
ncbi:unnamed protein product [Bursaphelenchus okinawaensis]|uniref:ANK_REP_REGION domain-containing protein n=1 Tax=Bursaphelenchus okinawaensis TaxID=465554 RepID=A0A811KGD8_9BILA|nr:unnamed protein product [Bursaphelenchus okinawaensis]CAG9101757.1 unnamed protein product [Bursaphelenchus okinawaensis]